MDCTNIAVRRGAISDLVGEIQSCMISQGYYLGAKVDNYFGPYMQSEVERFQKDHNITVGGCWCPNTCEKAKCTSTKVKRGYWWGLYEKTMGVVVDNARELWDSLIIHGADYGFYYDDKLGNLTVINRLKSGGLVNCTDIAQLLKKILEEMGYTVRFVRLEVKCSNGIWYGHVIVEFMGRGYNNWTILDGSNKLSKKASAVWNKMICNGGSRNRTVNPAWLVNAQDNK